MKFFRLYHARAAMVVLALLSFAFAVQCRAAPAGPTDRYLLGLTKYLSTRPAWIRNGSEIEGWEKVVLFVRAGPARKPGDANVAEYLVVYPQWKLLVRLGIADYAEPPIPVRYKNSGYRVKMLSGILADWSEIGWDRHEFSIEQIEAFSLAAHVRPFSERSKKFVVEQLLHAGPYRSALNRFHFSQLFEYEDRVWIFDDKLNRLSMIESAGDLDDEVDLPKYPELLQRAWDIEQVDLAASAGLFQAGADVPDASFIYGFLSCFRREK